MDKISGIGKCSIFHLKEKKTYYARNRISKQIIKVFDGQMQIATVLAGRPHLGENARERWVPSKAHSGL